MHRVNPILLVALLGWSSAASAQVPRRQIPPSVLAELTLVENEFELALLQDCDASMCSSKGCAYVDHAVIDRPRRTSLPGLGEDMGPGSVEPQEFLTQARCSFAHEPEMDEEEALALVKRLGTKVSGGFVVVSVDRQALAPLPSRVEPDDADDAPTEVEPPKEVWSTAVAGRELWLTLLPHLGWMIAIGLLTVMGTVLTWAFRRVGQDSLEDRLLLAQVAAGGFGGEAPAAEGDAKAEDADAVFVAEQSARWRERMVGAARRDPQLQALARELLRAGDQKLLATAVLAYPGLLEQFPDGGDVAAAKLELAAYLREHEGLEADAAFYRDLNRHALSASLVAQSDAGLVKSLREDFGAAGLVGLIQQLSPRPGALVFAISPQDTQQEMVRLFDERTAADLAEPLLSSNRMDPAEADHLFAVLDAARAGGPLPAEPRRGEVSDRGTTFDAAAALSVLLPSLPPGVRTALFGAVLARFGGSVPAWYRSIFVPDMLLSLPETDRADVLLEVDAGPLAAWLQALPSAARGAVVATMPNALRASVDGAELPTSRSRLAALAEEGRLGLAQAFQGQLARAGRSFEEVLSGGTVAAQRPEGWDLEPVDDEA